MTAEIRLLGAAEARDGGGEQRTGAAVGDENAALPQALEQPAHARETREGGKNGVGRRVLWAR